MDFYEEAKEFYHTFDPAKNTKPTPLTEDEVKIRIHFMIEELVEYLASVSTKETFSANCDVMKQSIDAAYKKILAKKLPENNIVSQADALVDLLYFTFGTFVLMDTDPRPLYDIVHKANMGKLFPDGKPHYDEITGKVLKPSNWEQDFAPENKLKAEIERQSES